MATPFIGDGAYQGDGGVLLQKLWDKWPWKPLPNAPGRYTMRRVGDGIPPQGLLETAGIKSVKLEKMKRGTETVLLVELEGGGGLVTVVNPDGTFVHTLNTKSSLQKYRSAC